MDETYCEAESLITLDFPSKAELIFDFDEVDSKKKDEDDGLV